MRSCGYNLCMKRILLPLLCLFFLRAAAQQDDGYARAFPITDYVTDLNDSTFLVQLYLPKGPQLREKMMGLLQGRYNDKLADTGRLGGGRCQLIKKDYYYFSISHKASARRPVEGDLLYVMLPATTAYRKLLGKLASHYIELDNVYDEPFYDREAIFTSWTPGEEKAAIDSMVSDIHFTGDYFLKNNPDQNILISSGDYTGKKVLDVMMNATAKDVTDFLSYVSVRPALYAGRQWKVTEVFATWLTSGAPRPIYPE